MPHTLPQLNLRYNDDFTITALDGVAYLVRTQFLSIQFSNYYNVFSGLPVGFNTTYRLFMAAARRALFHSM